MRLNLATRRYHADVDEPWLELLRPTIGPADYIDVLVRTYGLVAPFEGACRYTPGLVKLVDFRHLMRAGLIAQDLLALGLRPLEVATIPTCSSVAIFRGVPESLGWLYVVERSTLLHGGIRRHLQRHMRDADDASAYLSAHEGHVTEHWADFGRVLDRVGGEPAIANQIIRAACDAFATSGHWLRTARNQARNVG